MSELIIGCLLSSPDVVESSASSSSRPSSSPPSLPTSCFSSSSSHGARLICGIVYIAGIRVSLLVCLRVFLNLPLVCLFVCAYVCLCFCQLLSLRLSVCSCVSLRLCVCLFILLHPLGGCENNPDPSKFYCWVLIANCTEGLNIWEGEGEEERRWERDKAREGRRQGPWKSRTEGGLHNGYKNNDKTLAYLFIRLTVHAYLCTSVSVCLPVCLFVSVSLSQAQVIVLRSSSLSARLPYVSVCMSSCLSAYLHACV